ncbi:hypothetical protein [Pseudomonas chlororaphis]|uniref:Uncharacterized protein n=1 Tax=Pseudomonas chlororaphis TaxID=587753 RepID=A0AAX3G1H0_9PSED|nr:hypothetical protein [Pseudomonas chlororaphis]AZC34609.1 hypothetical protein C4K37_0190 [Pseudomonas chlororaphis subsp. piscium]AZC41147.1 hypothetical protein C4K36_0190 [Pseudomonas chlororaphis subsp. piscium]WDG73152.1 hypothetical protein PUP65_02000 [Pseudomonas chlororaphis]WDH71674.1 hypothetical protein PUP78_02000 [Pseudomonas chlororaphis]VEF75575.1 Uncharacterised protein [Pseudomonas chlororaphis]
MTDARQLPPTEEERMLEHIRQHSHGEPPASLDALIMATARREAPIPKPSLWQRWFDLCRQPRWQVAFAGLFGVTLLLGVLQRTPEPAPRQVLAPAPMAKAAAPQLARRQAESAPAGAAPAESVRAESSLEESNRFELAATPHASGALSAPAPAAPVAGLPLTRDTEAFSAEPYESLGHLASFPGKEQVERDTPESILDDALRDVLHLRQTGQGKIADQYISALKQRFPHEDIDARLRALQQP